MVILFSHPADFTPVCTTEFMTFASIADEFKVLNTELLGLSVDSIYAHIAWLRKIQELEWNGMKNVEVKFPLIEDIKMVVANKFGMIQPGQSNTQAVRAVFIINPDSRNRTILYYPLSMGRNSDEIKRIIIALQKTDKDKVATPANWRRGMMLLFQHLVHVLQTRKEIIFCVIHTVNLKLSSFSLTVFFIIFIKKQF